MEESKENEYLKIFLEDYFPKLPFNVIIEIVSLLSFDHIVDFLLIYKKPTIRNIIIQEYYSRELHFILSPTRRPYYSLYPQLKREFIRFKSYFEIKQFLDENTDINPTKLLLVSGGDFVSMSTLMQEYRHRFVNDIKYLDITLENYELNEQDFRFLLSFPNLRKLHFSTIKLTNCQKFLKSTTELRDHDGLEDIVFLGHSINDWSSIKLPSNLRHLDLSWNNNVDINTISVPPKVNEIYWNYSGITDQTLLKRTFPSNLNTLMLTYNNLDTIDVSILPKTLEYIDLSYNSIRYFKSQPDCNEWPPNLKAILLSYNNIDNESLEELARIKWPAFLKNLVLECNPFSSLAPLHSLPDNLNILDLSQTRVTSFKVNSTQEYPYYKFPESLKILRLSSCELLSYTHPSLQTSPRIKFPLGLTDLDLTECKIKSLHCFQFPTSLRILALSGNGLTDLASYNSRTGEDSHVCWTQLHNLTDLDLYSNYISSIDNWEIPQSLKRLDLRLNMFVEISLHAPLFNQAFSQSTKNLKFINLSQCRIKTITEDIYIPSNLQILLMAENFITGDLVIPSTLSNHSELTTLDLAGNYIQDLIFKSPGLSKLHSIDLTGNVILKAKPITPFETRKKVSDFYDNLEKGFGIKFTKRKFNINSLHTI